MFSRTFIRHGLIVVSTLVALAGLPAMAEDAFTDVVNAPGPFAFEGESYALSWTSHPNDTLYKQEYLPAGQTTEHYASMFMLDVTTSGVTVSSGVSAHADALEQRKATDPLLNYRTIQNNQTGEVILDCILSDASGPETVVEWDAYRYTPVGDGIAVFAISKRAYGNDVEPFLANLVNTRRTDIEALASLELPQVQAPQ